MDIVEIAPDRAALLLVKSEGHFLDFKAIEVSPAKLTRALSAFCNADGGDLYVGIDETTPGVFSWRGFADVEDANGHLSTFEMVSPFGIDLTGEFMACPGLPGLVLHINALKSRFVRTSSDGTAYKRLGAQSLAVVGEGLTELRRLKGIESFEDETLGIPLEAVTNSVPVLEYLLEAVPTAEPEVYLRGQYLIHGELPTVAAVLLFAEEPQAALPKRSGIKIYRYKSNVADREQLVATPTTIEGNLYTQIYAAVQGTVEMISEARFLAEDGLRIVRYPDDALHEIITNAVLHRDYSILDDVHIRIYENRIEVESPGRLPGHITPSNILSDRLSRNPNLVRHVNRFPDPPNQDVGEGLDTAFASMRRLNLRQPEIVERPNSVLVIIRHESLASPEQQIVEYLQTNDAIRNVQARELVGMESESKMKKILQNLVAAGEIEHVPGTTRRGYAYRLPV
ncbi:MAG: ATP-dependent helicase RecG [Actinomycetota bacterium]|nr:ATP-dependent helicase RecG [Actinomycetota bacterium]